MVFFAIIFFESTNFSSFLVLAIPFFSSLTVSFPGFFPESMSNTFAMFCTAPRNDFRSLLDVGGFKNWMILIFSAFVVIPFSLISCSSQEFSCKMNSVFLSFALYPSF